MKLFDVYYYALSVLSDVELNSSSSLKSPTRRKENVELPLKLTTLLSAKSLRLLEPAI